MSKLCESNYSFLEPDGHCFNFICHCVKGIQTGEISMVIGTHSLIAESVEFLALRIAVVDEQHRFGVIQRGRFNSKVVQSFFFKI